MCSDWSSLSVTRPVHCGKAQWDLNGKLTINRVCNNIVLLLFQITYRTLTRLCSGASCITVDVGLRGIGANTGATFCEKSWVDLVLIGVNANETLAGGESFKLSLACRSPSILRARLKIPCHRSREQRWCTICLQLPMLLGTHALKIVATCNATKIHRHWW